MGRSLAYLAPFLLSFVAAQTPGSTPDNHPALTTYQCTAASGCSELTTSLVLDSGSHNVHKVGDPSTSCGSWGSPPDPSLCPDAQTCAQNCVMDGITDYSTMGVTTDGSSVTLQQLNSGGTVVSPRVYLLDEGGDGYQMMTLNGGEISFDVDVSKLPCGMNGAFYFSEMPSDGGESPLNPGGAAWGTGYCDAQCFVTPFISGVGNIAGNGACCNELDVWEANSAATQLAPHTCSQPGLYQCSGDECNTVCDKNGCAMNPYKTGDTSYYGSGMTVDTTQPFTVVTQFISSGGTLSSIRRMYLQGGNVLANSSVSAIDDGYCASSTSFEADGGMAGMGGALTRGMVLAMSVWWDASGFMTWLDTGDAGPCSANSGDPTVIQQAQPDPAVTFSNIKFGDIDSTYTVGS